MSRDDTRRPAPPGGVMVTAAREIPLHTLAGRVVSGAGDLGPFHGPLVSAEALAGDMVSLWVTDRRRGDTGHVLPGNAGVIVHSVGYGERRRGQSNERNR